MTVYYSNPRQYRWSVRCTACGFGAGSNAETAEQAVAEIARRHAHATLEAIERRPA